MKMYVNMSEHIARGLIKMAREENRTIRDQITFIVKKELEWRGLLTSSTPTTPDRVIANEH